MSSLVLVDTSIWIDFINKGEFATAISLLAERNRLATCGIVKTELLPFVRKQKQKFEVFFEQMSYLPFEEAYWRHCAQTQETIIKKGFHPYAIPDLMILVLCLNHPVELFTKDTDFSRAATIFNFKLYSTP